MIKKDKKIKVKKNIFFFMISISFSDHFIVLSLKN